MNWERFFARDAEIVAIDLLGKILIRKIGNKMLKAKIVETEAYYCGGEDPASKAGKAKFAELMFGRVGKTFIYMVHNNWLLNMVAHPKGKVGAVLIRAIEPIKGVELMRKNRGVKEIYNLTSGPGKLTKALKITKDLNGIDIMNSKSELTITEGKKEKLEIRASHRIGVTKDLEKPLRFYIKENKFISRK